MKEDLEKYIQRRKRVDKAFATDFESGYKRFKKTLGGKLPNAVTARTLKASNAGKQSKRMARKTELYEDLGL